MGEDQGHHEGWVKTWGDARQLKEALRWEVGRNDGTFCQVMLRTAGLLYEWGSFDPTWRPWEQSLSGGDAHYTLLGSLIHVCVYSNQLTGISFVPSNCFMLRKSL